jgi:hypothetical protein
VIRYDHPKDFRPWIWNGQKLVCTLPDAERMPYRLPELLATPLEAPVFLVEGEKACNALVAQGLAATCASGGAQARWHEQFNTYFAGRRVVILPDNDAPGQKCMQARAPGLANVAASLKVLDLPGLPPKGDAFDYFAVGGSVADLLRLVGQTQEWQPGKQEEEDASEYDALLEKLTFSLDDLLEEEHPPLKWAVEGFIPEGLTLLAGKPKVGKSWLVLSIGLAIAYGGYALGKIKVEQGDVLYLALEDRKKRLKNRAEKVGAIKGKNQHFIMATEWPRLGDGGKELLEAWIKKHPDTRLIIIDTLAKIKSHSPAGKTLYDEDYQSLEPLQALSQQYSVPIVVITHLRKMDAEDAFDTINASLGLNGVADTLLVLKKQRGKADAVLCGVGREGDEFEKVIRFDPATCTWILQGDAENYVPTEERRRIIEALAKAAPKALTPREIAHQIDAEANNVTQLLFKLKTAGQVITPSYGKYTIPNNTDKTEKSDESKTSEAEAEEAEEAEAEEPGEEYTDKTGDKTFEPVAADGDRSLITLTTLIEFDNELETPPAQPDDLAAQWIATYGPKPLPLAARRAPILQPGRRNATIPHSRVPMPILLTNRTGGRWCPG